MDTVLLSAVLVVLIVVAVELGVLIRHFAQLPDRASPRHGEAEGATIHVNVGTITGGVPSTLDPDQPTPQGASPGLVTVTEALPEPPVEPAPPPPPAPTMASRRTESAVVVVKCPKCGAENSSYRSECFLCESHL